MADLLVHPVFDEEFRASFTEKFADWERLDEEAHTELMKQQLKTKDGREELDEADLVTEDEKKPGLEDEVEEDDDDSSSAIASPNDSSCTTPVSSSGIDKPPLSADRGTAERASKVQSHRAVNGEKRSSGAGASSPTFNRNAHSGSPASWSEDSNDSINKHAQKVEEKLAKSGHDPLGHAAGQAKCLLLSSKNLEAEETKRQGRAASESN